MSLGLLYQNEVKIVELSIAASDAMSRIVAPPKPTPPVTYPVAGIVAGGPIPNARLVMSPAARCVETVAGIANDSPKLMISPYHI
jgi:hypothetical protein